MQELEKKLNYTFRNQELLREALNHSSYANEHRSQGLGSNERLEFLGDSVLGFVTAEYLFARHPDLPEGDLTRIRAALVCEQSLHEVAQKLNLGSYLKLGNFLGFFCVKHCQCVYIVECVQQEVRTYLIAKVFQFCIPLSEFCLSSCVFSFMPTTTQSRSKSENCHDRHCHYVSCNKKPVCGYFLEFMRL